MRHRPENILRMTAPLRGFAHRFAYVFLLAAALGILLLGRADPQIFQRARTAVTDITAPVLDALSRPAVTISHLVAEARELARLREENIILRAENERLLKWQNAARTLLAENRQLHELLNFTPAQDATSVTARVIGDSGGAFVRSLLVNAGRGDGVSKGNAALSGKGLLGRVAEVGDRSARVLLINDLNSRIPVVIERSRERAILAGDNSVTPRLLYLPVTTSVQVGDRVVTSGHGGAFPVGLPVGVVSAISDEGVRVTPFADATNIEYVRLMDFGLDGILSDADEDGDDMSGSSRSKRRALR